MGGKNFHLCSLSWKVQVCEPNYVLEFSQASVAGTIETLSGIETVTDATLPRTILKAKHTKTGMSVSQKFMT